MRELAKNRLYLHRPCSMLITLFHLRGDIDLTRFASAIEKAMGRHEQLCSRIVQTPEGQAGYVPMEKPRVEITTETYEPAESADEESLTDIAFEWADAAVRFQMDLAEGELMRHVLISDGLETIWGVASHYLAGDAFSIQFLAKDVFRILDQPGTELSLLPWQEVKEADLPLENYMFFTDKLKFKRINKMWAKDKRVFGSDDLRRMHHNFHEAYPLHSVHTELSAETVESLQRLTAERKVRFSSLLGAVFVMASRETDALSLPVSIRPEGYEGVGNYLGSLSLQVPKKVSSDLWSAAVDLTEKIDKGMTMPTLLHHSAIILQGVSDTLIDAGYYAVYDGFKSTAALQMSGLYGLTTAGTGTQINNLKILPLAGRYGFGFVEHVYVMPPMAPNFARIVGVATVENRLSITMTFYQDKAHEQRLLDRVKEILETTASL